MDWFWLDDRSREIRDWKWVCLCLEGRGAKDKCRVRCEWGFKTCSTCMYVFKVSGLCLSCQAAHKLYNSNFRQLALLSWLLTVIKLSSWRVEWSWNISLLGEFLIHKWFAVTYPNTTYNNASHENWLLKVS